MFGSDDYDTIPNDEAVPVAPSSPPRTPARPVTSSPSDGPLQSPPVSSSGSARARTPNRSTSRPKTMPMATIVSSVSPGRVMNHNDGRPHPMAPAKTIRSRKSAPGRRKMRRWLNAHVLNQGAFIHRDATMALEDMTLRYEWTSQFAELFKPENAEILRLMSRGAMPSTNDDDDERKLDEDREATGVARLLACYQRIDHRLREVLEKEFDRCGVELLDELECLYKAFIRYGKEAAVTLGPRASKVFSCEPAIRSDNGTIVLELVAPSGYHRLLLHGVAQFFGMSCKSLNRGGVRFTQLKLGKNTGFGELPSLVEYLSYRYMLAHAVHTGDDAAYQHQPQDSYMGTVEAHHDDEDIHSEEDNEDEAFYSSYVFVPSANTVPMEGR